MTKTELHQLFEDNEGTWKFALHEGGCKHAEIKLLPPSKTLHNIGALEINAGANGRDVTRTLRAYTSSDDSTLNSHVTAAINAIIEEVAA